MHVTSRNGRGRYSFANEWVAGSLAQLQTIIPGAETAQKAKAFKHWLTRRMQPQGRVETGNRIRRTQGGSLRLRPGTRVRVPYSSCKAASRQMKGGLRGLVSSGSWRYLVAVPDRKITLFLSHAWDDKESFVEDLYQALKDEFDVWYDKARIKLGDSIYEKISEGIRECDFDVVVLSPHFLRKNWTQEEFNGLKALQTEKRKVILPILHNLTIDELKAKIFYRPSNWEKQMTIFPKVKKVRQKSAKLRLRSSAKLSSE